MKEAIQKIKEFPGTCSNQFPEKQEAQNAYYKANCDKVKRQFSVRFFAFLRDFCYNLYTISVSSIYGLQQGHTILRVQKSMSSKFLII